MVRQATKYLLCIALATVGACGRESGTRKVVPTSRDPFTSRVNVHNGKRYLIIEFSDNRSYAVPVDPVANESPTQPCECELKECRPMCGTPPEPTPSEPVGAPAPSDARTP